MEKATTQKVAYLHQSQAIGHLLLPEATPLVVTTGTGSGKTECFLLPVIQNAIEDATAFKQSGLTAILVYPMNALANDQQARIERYLKDSGHDYVKVARYDRSTKQEEREQLRKHPPHILLTNYVMLEYLLVRPADREDIFADHRCRFLVLDEVHTYRGSLGANIALLVRRLRAHLDGARQNWNVDAEQSRRFPKLIHVGTSATIKSIDEAGKTPEDIAKERDAAVQGFFSTLAGVDGGSIRVIGEEKCDLTIPDGARWTQNPQEPKFNLDVAASIRQAVQQLAGADQGTSLAEAASSAAIFFKLNELLARKPLSIEKALDCIIEEVPERKLSLRDCVRGEVAAALSLGSSLPDGMPGALRLRTHRFIRGGWKFFRCVDPKCGHLYPKGEEQCCCGKRTAPLYICRACGADTLRFTGDNDDPSKTPLSPNDTRGKEDEWVLYNLARIEELAEDEEPDLGTGRTMRKRSVVKGSFDPETLQFSLGETDYSVPCILAPGRGTCLVCGGRAGSKDVLTPVALGTSAEVRVIAESVLEGLADEHDKESKGSDRKERLLIFADSRQDAAHQARFITYAGRYDRMRRRLVAVLPKKGELSLEDAVRALVSQGVKNHDNPHTSKFDDDKYLSAPVRERASAWEEAPLLDDIAITSGYRATILNLGLVGVRYAHLDKYLEKEGKALAAELGLTTAQLSFVARCVLDEMRRRGALSRGLLTYNPSSVDCPEAYGHHADWERRLRWPTGFAYDPKAKQALAYLDKSEVHYGIGLQNFWRRPKTGGQGPLLERRFKTLVKNLNGKIQETDEGLMSLVRLLMKGPCLIVPSKLRGDRKSLELLQLNADCVNLALTKADDRFKCSICNVRMPWVVEGTPCPACQSGRLQPWSEEEVAASRYVARIQSQKLIPLLAGEHTAQVTGERRLELEGEFKAESQVSPVNVICCSPTLEMGIDVGGLDAVVLRNVPPRPDNYAQRGGRAGRRTRVGIVIGFARNTPHDGYFYDKPGEMIAGEVPAPGVGLGNRDVTIRHLYAMVFGSAEPGLSGRMGDYITIQGDLVEPRIDELIVALEAQFGHAAKLAMNAWGEDIRVPAGIGTDDDIRAALSELPSRTRDLFGRVSLQVRQLEETIKNWQAVGRGDHQAINAMELKRRLLGIREGKTDRDADDRTSGHPMRRFAEFGILPGYEFPSEPCTVRLLRDNAEDEPISVERRFGIAQYQPDALAHARGHRWRVIGLDLASPWNPKSKDPDWVYSVCKNCQMRYETQQVRCPRCNSTDTIVSGLAGYAYGGFVARRDDSPVLEEEDRYSKTGIVEAYPQHDGQPVYHYDLPTGWFAELRRNETIQWVNEGRPVSAQQKKQGAPILHEKARGFYLCAHCGRNLVWPDDMGEPTAKDKGRKKTAKAKEDRFEHAPTCPEVATAPVPCAIVSSNKATTLRIFVDLPLDWKENFERYHRWGYSLGYAIRIGMRQLYMLDGPEIEFSLEPMWQTEANGIPRLRGALTFLDPALGGSGFLDRAARELHLVAQRTIEHLNHSGCESACYRCLKSYNNQRHHGFLDWLHVSAELDELAANAPTLTGKNDYDPQPWLDAYHVGVGSPLELKFLRLFEKHGVAVDKQVPIAANEGDKPITVADFVVKGTKLAIYVDGAAFHFGERLRRDRVIRGRLAEGTAAWRVVELRASHLNDEAGVVAMVKSALPSS